MQKITTLITTALRNEWARAKRRLARLVPHGTGISKRTLDLAIYFALVLAGTSDALRYEFGWSWYTEAALWAYIVLALIVSSYIAGGIYAAQSHARMLEVEIERLKSKLDRHEERDPRLADIPQE